MDRDWEKGYPQTNNELKLLIYVVFYYKSSDDVPKFT